LEARVKALEDGAKYDATQVVLKQREEEHLLQLRAIKEAMLAEKNAGGGASSEEAEQLKAENAKLKALVTKQEYRIKHLINGFQRALDEKAAMKA